MDGHKDQFDHTFDMLHHPQLDLDKHQEKTGGDYSDLGRHASTQHDILVHHHGKVEKRHEASLAHKMEYMPHEAPLTREHYAGELHDRHELHMARDQGTSPLPYTHFTHESPKEAHE